jgi:hypothetical protein
MRKTPTLILLSMLLPACQVISFSSAPSEVSSGEVLFQDSFSDPHSGWDRILDSETGVVDYFNGLYRIMVNQSYQMLWSGPGLSFEDVDIHVDSIPLNQTTDDNFGIVCRAQNDDNFYFLVISSDGYYGIGKVKNGVQKLITMPAMLPSEDIYMGTHKNHIQAECIGDTLSLHTNDKLLISVQDEDFTSGGVGLVAGTFEESRIEVFFDNFTVLKP